MTLLVMKKYHRASGNANRFVRHDEKSSCVEKGMRKYIKITQVKNAEGEIEKHDIKNTGDYVATISLLKDISSEFKISVVAE